uniref:RRM domain-containing protein n=1 Tax=Chromera velia CCMP2878 TaxID=1169474 RepID=A0A0G4HK25_9ALVE|eukprot:Cvel_28353.t1-p1 / transcript=Cvel_28353.t1 / gene=Cvel_28353 / organism=Chromera_velia_CCMP2878 / gene_product=CUGBP Elav-like family member 6, putative / transcript_product=CUGBP Elav-like family member 6, putative / location=Cvel_scaffold3691:2250-5987(+) / protein_length=838 / sequence_SO=supercontig / SO=protein_coding / is_pseudo=false
MATESSYKVLVSSIPGNIDEEFIRVTFAPFGSISSLYYFRAEDGKPTGWASVSFESPQSVLNSVKSLKGQLVVWAPDSKRQKGDGGKRDDTRPAPFLWHCLEVDPLCPETPSLPMVEFHSSRMQTDSARSLLHQSYQSSSLHDGKSPASIEPLCPSACSKSNPESDWFAYSTPSGVPFFHNSTLGLSTVSVQMERERRTGHTLGGRGRGVPWGSPEGRLFDYRDKEVAELETEKENLIHQSGKQTALPSPLANKETDQQSETATTQMFHPPSYHRAPPPFLNVNRNTDLPPHPHVSSHVPPMQTHTSPPFSPSLSVSWNPHGESNFRSQYAAMPPPKITNSFTNPPPQTGFPFFPPHLVPTHPHTVGGGSATVTGAPVFSGMPPHANPSPYPHETAPPSKTHTHFFEPQTPPGKLQYTQQGQHVEAMDMQKERDSPDSPEYFFPSDTPPRAKPPRGPISGMPGPLPAAVEGPFQSNNCERVSSWNESGFGGRGMGSHPSVCVRSYLRLQNPNNGMGMDKHFIENSAGCNLFMFHLPGDWEDSDLVRHFLPFGPVTSALIARERETGRNKGFGYVCFGDAQSACSAIQGLDGFPIGGKRLSVQLKETSRRRKPVYSGAARTGNGGVRGGAHFPFKGPADLSRPGLPSTHPHHPVPTLHKNPTNVEGRQQQSESENRDSEISRHLHIPTPSGSHTERKTLVGRRGVEVLAVGSHQTTPSPDSHSEETVRADGQPPPPPPPVKESQSLNRPPSPSSRHQKEDGKVSSPPATSVQVTHQWQRKKPKKTATSSQIKEEIQGENEEQSVPESKTIQNGHGKKEKARRGKRGGKGGRKTNLDVAS